MCASADIVLEGEPPGRLAALGLDAAHLRDGARRAHLGLGDAVRARQPARDEPFADLTVLAGGGPVWNCGYDDHTLPPVRGGGNQGYQTASLHAVVATLVAVLHRDATGAGQLVDVSMHAAANVTTEAGSYTWLVAQETVQRQTCRHAAVIPTQVTLTYDTEGRFVPTGIPPRSGKEFQILLDWLDALRAPRRVPRVVLPRDGREAGCRQLRRHRSRSRGRRDLRRGAATRSCSSRSAHGVRVLPARASSAV